MKRLHLSVILLTCMWSAFGLNTFSTIPAKSEISLQQTANKEYLQDWKQIDSLMNINLPKSALEIVDKIYAETRLQNNMPQLVKACLYRASLQNSYEEEALPKTITEIENIIEEVSFPAKNILHSVAAELYWSYYQQNRWKFTGRTASENTSDDLQMWDLRKLVAHCEMHYTASLENLEKLQTIGISEFDAILEKQKNSQLYRPTLYDFLTFRAVEFYSHNESNLVQPAIQFLVDDGAYFSNATQFSQLLLTVTDSLSFKFQTLKLLQKNIAFHLHDSDPTALIDADLQRLHFVYTHATLVEKDSLYLSALQDLDNRFESNPASAEILYQIAKLYKKQGEIYDPFTNMSAQWKNRDALNIIEKAISRAPESFGATNCKALKNEIEQPQFTLTTDEANLPQKPILASIRYKNIQKIYFKIVPLDFKKSLTEPYIDNEKFYTNLAPVKTWNIDLPNDNDSQNHTMEIALPELPIGYYAVLSSTDERFSENSTIWKVNKIWITNICYVQKNVNGTPTFLLLNRETGAPIRNAIAQTYTRKYNYNKRNYEVKYGDTLRSNAEGEITIKAKSSNGDNMWLYFVNGKDVYNGPNVYVYKSTNNHTPFISTTLFTDRAIYRPGQTVFFKGIVLKHDELKTEKTTIVPKHKQTIVFYNVNHEKVSEQVVVTNEFGSFSGNFVIPANGLTGQMHIQSQNGSTSFRVEEYKRPKFEVTFTPIEQTYRLGEKIMVSGNAKAYAGSAVSDAKVTFRVMRQARYPYWRWWMEPMPNSPAQEIVNGESITKEDGSFDIEFMAAPDQNINKKQSPIFNYSVYVSVSDINGETHEAQTMIPVGYRSLLISTNIPEKLNLNECKAVEITATNLNGKSQDTKGILTIWKLQEPTRVLQTRQWDRPDKFSMTRAEFEKNFPNSVYDNENNVANWEKGTCVCTMGFDTKVSTTCSIPQMQNWKVGKYLLVLSTTDEYGESVESTTIFTGFSTLQKTTSTRDPIWFEVLTPTVQPGEIAKISVGSAYEELHAILEIVEDNYITQRQILKLNKEQKIIEIPVLEKHRGNFGVNLFFVKNNRPYNEAQVIQVPYDNKKLNIEFASFRDKLAPGQEEEWHITIKDKLGDFAAAELLASMYDASLDAFVPHSWRFFPWRNKNIRFIWSSHTSFQIKNDSQLAYNYRWLSPLQRHYDKLIISSLGWPNEPFSLEETIVVGYGGRERSSVRIRGAAQAEVAEVMQNEVDMEKDSQPVSIVSEEEPVWQESAISPVQVRTNFNETAFFYPQLSTNEQGEIVIKFTIPESLTRWKMQGLAWTKDLKIGSISKELVTQKDLMIFTNAPRFFRENDTIYFSAKLSNMSEKILNVNTQIQFFDALTMKPISESLLLEDDTKKTLLAAGSNVAIHWKLHIPEGLQAVTYRIVSRNENFSDGEENTIPILTNRMLVTESLLLPINGNQTKVYEFTKLLRNQSSTLKNYSYTIEFVSNPVWNAIQALPYVMEYPYECSEQAFSRYYANSIATHIVNSDPKIKQVFDIWRNYQPNALQSNLEKNEELKLLLLEETPWVREAQNESERKQRIALLFDLNKMNNELASALRKVEQSQTPNGGFAWFKGSPDNRYITQHIVAGIGHLQKMKIQTKASGNMLQKAIRYMDARLAEDFTMLKQQAEKDKEDYKKDNHLSYLIIHYLYARSFFLKTHPVPQETQEAFNFYNAQAATYWTKNNNYLKGMLALSLNRNGDVKTAQLIMKSLGETALHNEEMGMYWNSETNGWWWYQAPVETQALMIEAYHEILNDQKSINALKVWLLKQKQTTSWKTTKATSEAVYALLIFGNNLLANNDLCEITVGSQTIDPNKLEGANHPEAGTGYFKTSWKGDEVKAEMGKITVKNPNPTIAWGAAYWQYFEQLDKISTAETNVKIHKQLFVKTNSSTGPMLNAITNETPIKTGDKITVRIEIRCDRDMEYVHLKDMRASTFEPVNILSGYRRQGGIGYYESTRDAATNFFISYLPKGYYVFEYDLIATQQGEFSNGITSLQCMYAPEFTAHSEGIRIRVE